MASVCRALVIAVSSSEVFCLDAFSISSALGIVTAELFFWPSACAIFSCISLALAACSSSLALRCAGIFGQFLGGSGLPEELDEEVGPRESLDVPLGFGVDAASHSGPAHHAAAHHHASHHLAPSRLPPTPPA